MIAQPMDSASDIQPCFGAKAKRPKQLLYRRSFSLNAIANVQVDFFYANGTAGSEVACRSAEVRSPLFVGGGHTPCWSAASRIAEEPEDTGDDVSIAEMISGSDAAESLASDLLERHVNNFFQCVVIPAVVFVCLVYAFINAPVPAKGQIYRSLAATFCLLVGFAVQCCFVTLWSPDGS